MSNPVHLVLLEERLQRLCEQFRLAELAVRANVDEALLRKAAAEGVTQVLQPARDRLLAA